ncbi:MAG: Hsp70 family protein [Sandaracinaceae bacterium]|nr:Hsp70 family protein [Sandaracinaceae bacterium]
MRLGIDLGTTRTVIARVDGGRYPIVSIDTGLGSAEWVPGACAERADGTRVHGWEALAADDAPALLRSVKRAISGLPADAIVEALPSRPTAAALLDEHVAHVLACVRRALSLANDAPISAMIAVPANATSRQRWLTLEAFRRAGVEVLGLVNEPTAAGIEYAHRHLGLDNKRSPKRYLVVYDLGGGTFDTSAISLKGRLFELLATEGIARLGGDDLDEAILALALERAGLDVRSFDAATHARLADAARAAKEALGPHSKNAMIDLAMALPDAAPIVVPAADVLRACEPLVDRTLAMIDSLLASLPAHGIDPEDARQLGAVYVVGGGAAFVGVLKALRAKLGRKVEIAPVPHAATAIGLAVAADEDAGIFVKEAVTRHFGVWREAQGGREKIFDPIFDKGAANVPVEDTSADSSGPIVAERRYRPRHTVGHLRFLECARRDVDGGPAGEITPWREILFPYDPALKDEGDLRDRTPQPLLGREEIREQYRYGADGSISVRIDNLTSGYGRTFELGRIE